MDMIEVIMNKIEEAKEISKKNPSLSFEICKEALNIAKENELKLEEAHSLLAMASACRSMTKLNDCFNYAFDAHKLFENCNNSMGIANALNQMGIVYFYYAMYEPALHYFYKALNLAKEIEDYISMSRIYNNMGEVYREAGNLDEALTAYNQALNICKRYDYVSNMAVILANLGEVYFRKCDFSYSYACYKKSYDILIDSQNITGLSEVENRIGKIYFVQKEYDKAREYYHTALKRLEEIQNKYFTIDVLINIAELEMLENKKPFLGSLVKAIRYGEEINARKKLSQIYKMITEFYEEKGDYELSLEFYKRYHLIEQEIEAAVISHKLEIIKLELNKVLDVEAEEEVNIISMKLEQDIMNQNKQLDSMEKANRNLKVEVLSNQ